MNTKFWEQVTMLKTTDCWPWNGEHDKSGRPLFNSEKAYRTAYQLRNGDLRSGNHVHHTCENCACVNPKHLVQLTPEEHTAAHQAINSSDRETLRQIYSGQLRIDSIGLVNYREELRKRKFEAEREAVRAHCLAGVEAWAKEHPEEVKAKRNQLAFDDLEIGSVFHFHWTNPTELIKTGTTSISLKTGMAGVETVQATQRQTNPIAPRWTFRVRTH
jgi:hypothetical protein